MRPNKPIASLKKKWVDKFWGLVSISDNDSCWEWLGTKNKSGYGRFYCMGGERPAHRISYFIKHKVDPCELMVCHTCDNPICVNPNHFFLGTHSDNSNDMFSKGRGNVPKGEKAHSNKLFEYQVVEIIDRFSKGETHLGLAECYGVSGATIRSILVGKKWKYLKIPIDNLKTGARKGEDNYIAKLKTEDVLKIKELYTGKRGDLTELGKMFSVTKCTINDIMKGRSWKHLLPKTG